MRPKPVAAPAVPAVFLLMALLSLAGNMAHGAQIPTAVTIPGGSESVLEALAELGEGDGVLLIAPGLRYYAALSKHPRNISVLHVTPGKDPFSESQFEGWKRALPVPADSASLAGGVIRGRVGNAEIRVVGLPGIGLPAKRCVVILDPEIFPLLYENEVRGGLIDLSMRLYRSLSDNAAVGFPLYIVDPLPRGSFPLKWGYAGALWADIWRRPAAFREALPEKWRLRKESEWMTGFGQFEAAAELLEQARRYFQEDGSLDYQLSGLSFMDRDVPSGLRFLYRAYRLDRRFLRAYAESGAYFLSKGRNSEAESVFRAGLSVAPDDPALNLALAKLLGEKADALKLDDPAGARESLVEASTLRISEERKKEVLERIESLEKALRR